MSLDERDDDAGQTDELARGRPTITLRSAGRDDGDANAATVEAEGVDAETAANVGTDSVDAETAASVETGEVELDTAASMETGDVDAANAAASEPIDVQALDRAGRFEWKPRRSLTERPKALGVAAIALLLVALGLQLVFEYRDALAAHVPATRPLLQHACDVLGCAIGPLRDAAALSIDASDLQADPAHKGLLLLSATIRNRAAYPIAYPRLELTLTDASDQVVVRRAFVPADYLGGTAIPSAGIAGNGEALVRLFIDASATAQAGYRLYLFYP